MILILYSICSNVSLLIALKFLLITIKQTDSPKMFSLVWKFEYRIMTRLNSSIMWYFLTPFLQIFYNEKVTIILFKTQLALPNSAQLIGMLMNLSWILFCCIIWNWEMLNKRRMHNWMRDCTNYQRYDQWNSSVPNIGHGIKNPNFSWPQDTIGWLQQQ